VVLGSTTKQKLSLPWELNLASELGNYLEVADYESMTAKSACVGSPDIGDRYVMAAHHICQSHSEIPRLCLGWSSLI
jgi:hypothetical protein